MLEQHVNQAKRDELEARALLHDANFEFEKFLHISEEVASNSEVSKNVTSLSVEDFTSLAGVQISDLVTKGSPLNARKVFIHPFIPSRLRPPPPNVILPFPSPAVRVTYTST